MNKLFTFSKRSQPMDFDGLMRPHLDMLYRLALRFCQQQHDAEDLVQDLMTKLYQRRDDLEDKQNLKAWLATSLYHLFIDGTRKRNRSPLQLVDDETTFYEGTPSRELGPEQQLSQAQRLKKMQHAFNQLSEEHRAVLALHDIEGYKLSELVEMLDIPLGTLKSRIHRARGRIRDLLREEEDIPVEVAMPSSARRVKSANENITPTQGNLLRALSVNRVRG